LSVNLYFVPAGWKAKGRSSQALARTTGTMSCWMAAGRGISSR
jgi:hypothetical protein